MTIRSLFLVPAGIVAAIGLLGWLGLQVQPHSFPSYASETSLVGETPVPVAPPTRRVPLPTGLPKPVERFYRTVYGGEIPVIETVVIKGRGVMKPFMNIPVPARFVFVHDTGEDYRHYFEATWFGMPVMKVNEGYLDGASFFEAPFGRYFDEVNANQGANLALWGEAIWFPSLWVTDPRAHWEPVDQHSALLHIPYQEAEESFLVRFNPRTGLIDIMETMRYRELGQGQPKILWILRAEDGHPVAGTNLPSVGSVMWLDQGEPWAYFNVEEMIYNTDVSTYIRQRGH